MNITIITSTLPYPLSSGGAQAQFNIIDELRHIHHISIIFPVNRTNKTAAMKQLQELWPEVNMHPYPYIKQLCHFPFFRDKIIRAFKLKFLYNNPHFQVERALKPYGYSYSHDFINFINNIINKEKTDILQIEFYPYLHLINKLPKGIIRVFIQHEIRYVRNKRLLSLLKLTKQEKEYATKIKQMEINDINQFNATITLTDVDKKTMEKDGVMSPIYTSPAAISSPLSEYEEWNGNLSFVGSHSHIPNQEGVKWFVDKVAPLLKTGRRTPLHIIGKGWTEGISSDYLDIIQHGFVKELHDVIHGSVMIVPILTGSGMRMKILEAAAMGIPFVTTTVGVEGLNFKHNVSCLVADSPEEFAKAIQLLMNDPLQRKRLAIEAQNIFINQYSKQALARQRNHIYLTIAEKFKSINNE